MKNYTMKRPYTDEQKEIILRALPTGITYQHYIYAATPEETEALNDRLIELEHSADCKNALPQNIDSLQIHRLTIRVVA